MMHRQQGTEQPHSPTMKDANFAKMLNLALHSDNGDHQDKAIALLGPVVDKLNPLKHSKILGITSKLKSPFGKRAHFRFKNGQPPAKKKKQVPTKPKGGKPAWRKNSTDSVTAWRRLETDGFTR
jgi:hypothetical protein